MHDEWEEFAYPKLIDMAFADPEYQQCFVYEQRTWEALEPLRKKLSDAQWHLIDAHIGSYDRSYRRILQLAYLLGKQQSKS